MDFTVKKYCQLLDALKASGLSFKLRHDVDLLPANSLRTAQLEKERGLTATYYFRCVPESYDPVIIKQVQGSDSAPCKSLDSITADTSDTEDRDTGTLELLHAVLTD